MITRTDGTVIFDESVFLKNTGGFGYVAEASELELPPGHWPEFAALTDVMGDRHITNLKRGGPIDGNAQRGYHYISEHSVRYTVYND